MGHLAGLLHDMGKVMALWGEPECFVVGDTFPVGCAFEHESNILPGSFDENPDSTDPRFNTKYGIYSPHCGIENLTMAWGHDEYMYRMLVHNKCTLPEDALRAIRFHSFYPWHERGGYRRLTSKEDIDQ